MILLACAVAKELEFWRERTGIELLVTGVGPIEAAAAVAAALARREYRLVVNAGIAGAFDGAARIGEGVAVAKETMELNLETGEGIALPSGERVVESASSEASLIWALRARGFAVLRGITVARVTSSEETAHRLRESRGAQIETMEGFAVLRAAQLAAVRAIELRGISNRCGARAHSGWDLAAGIAGLERITSALFEVLEARGEL